MPGNLGTPKDGGTYALLMHLEKARQLKVGALGRVGFPEGVYAYAGSATTNLRARLHRHARRRKRVHWHVDRLTVLRECQVLGAVVFGPGGPTECAIVDLLADLEGALVWPARFGASDHGCRGHLVRLEKSDDPTDIAVDHLSEHGGVWLPRDVIMRRGGFRKRRR